MFGVVWDTLVPQKKLSSHVPGRTIFSMFLAVESKVGKRSLLQGIPAFYLAALSIKPKSNSLERFCFSRKGNVVRTKHALVS